MTVSLPNFAPFDVLADRSQLGKMACKIRANVHRNEHYNSETKTSPAGPDVDEIFDTLPNTGEDNYYHTAVAKLHE